MSDHRERRARRAEFRLPAVGRAILAKHRDVYQVAEEKRRQSEKEELFSIEAAQFAHAEKQVAERAERQCSAQ